jgi:hypothetical protein
MLEDQVPFSSPALSLLVHVIVVEYAGWLATLTLVDTGVRGTVCVFGIMQQ